MVSESKSIKEQENKTYFWTSLKWYWFIAPSFYFLFIVPKMVGGNVVLTMGSEDMSTFLFQLLNYVMAGLMFVTNPTEQSKTGGADMFLKIALGQQFAAQNIFGILLTVLVWYKLPYKIDSSAINSNNSTKRYFKTNTISIIATTSLIIAIVLRIMSLN